MQLVGRSCDHCRDAIRVTREALGCPRCGVAVHVRCTSASAGYRGHVKSPACVRCGAALETGATPDTPPPRKHPSTPALALVVAAGLVGAFVGAWASALAPVLGPLGAASVGLAVSTGMGLVAIVARFSA